MKRPLSSVRVKASCSWGISGAYCALTSTWGIAGTASHGSRPSVPQDQIRDQQNDSRHERVLDVPEPVVDPGVARPERPAGAGPAEGPDRAAERREDDVAAELRLEHPGRNRDEGARDRRQPPDEHGPVLPSLEPA